MPPFLPLQGVLVANAEDDNIQLAANATTINVRKRSADSSFDMLAAADFDQRLYYVTRKRRVTGGQNTIGDTDWSGAIIGGHLKPWRWPVFQTLRKLKSLLRWILKVLPSNKP